MNARCKFHQFVILCLAPALLLTACFRDTSEAFVQQPVARENVTATPVVEAVAPTELPPPAATEAPTEAAAPVDDFALSATALIAELTQAASGQVAPPGEVAAGTPAPAQATSVPLVRATVPPGADCVHEIRAGETLFQLSLAYGVTVDQIAAASAIANPDVIAIGQRVVIPLCGTSGFIPPPTSVPTATLDAAFAPPTIEPEEVVIASVSDARDDLIQQAQSALLDNAQHGVGEFSVQSASSGGVYTVQEGDTLFLIAVRHGTTIEALAALNNITDIDEVTAGDRLQLP